MYIDIITVTYNNYNGLVKTAESIFTQVYRKIHWIVIDGFSSDKTIEYMLANQNSRDIKITFITEPDKGIYDAMNKGLNISKGDYAIFLNAGDKFTNESVLEQVFNTIKNDNIPALIYGDFHRELKNASLDFIKAKPIWYIFHSLPTSHQAIFYKRNAIGQLRYNLNYTVSSDYFFTAKFIKDLNIIKQRDYMVMPYVIVDFEYNGMSRKNLYTLYKDAYYIQKEVLKINLILRLLSYAIKYMRNKFL